MEQLWGRQGIGHHKDKRGQMPTFTDAGESRGMAAKKAGFGSDRTLERARKVPIRSSNGRAQFHTGGKRGNSTQHLALRQLPEGTCRSRHNFYR